MSRLYQNHTKTIKVVEQKCSKYIKKIFQHCLFCQLSSNVNRTHNIRDKTMCRKLAKRQKSIFLKYFIHSKRGEQVERIWNLFNSNLLYNLNFMHQKIWKQKKHFFLFDFCCSYKINLKMFLLIKHVEH